MVNILSIYASGFVDRNVVLASSGDDAMIVDSNIEPLPLFL